MAYNKINILMHNNIQSIANFSICTISKVCPDCYTDSVLGGGHWYTAALSYCERFYIASGKQCIKLQTWTVVSGVRHISSYL